MLYRLWDLGLKVGHATRSVDECIRQAKADMTIRTGLLESRFLWGDTKLFQELKRRFRREVVTGNGLDFVEAKLAERDQRHKRTGNSRYTLEPNIKEGKGGLRDLHTLYWIAKYLYQVDEVSALVERGVLSAAEVATFEKAAAFLWTVRCHLHYLAGRAEERLTFDLQPELARRMGYTDHAGTLRRRAADEALFPDRQERRRSDPHLLRRHRGGPSAPALPQAAQPGLPRHRAAPARDRGLRRRGRPPQRAGPRAVHQPAHQYPAAVRGGPAPRPRHPSHGLAPGHAPSEAGEAAAQRSRGQSPVPGHADLAQGSGDHLAPAERGRRLRPLHSGFRARRRPDAIRHVPPLHGGRAHHLRHRHAAQDRAGRADGRGAHRLDGGA